VTTKIFIGSASEALDYAEDVYAVLADFGTVVPSLWNKSDAFRPGFTIIENIERIGTEHVGAVLLATPDDHTLRRGKTDWTPRDNVVFEYGFLTGRYGREKVAIVRIGTAQLPSDLNGLVYLGLDAPARDERGDYDHDQFRLKLKDKLRPWVKQFIARPSATPKADDLPQLTSALTTRLENLRRHPHWAQDYDTIASELLEQLADSLGTSASKNLGIDHHLINQIARFSLPNATKIYAIDVLGPPGWLSPVSFRYLSVQIKEYLRKNIEENQWHLRVSEELSTAIKTALQRTPLTEGSKTLFDNPKQLFWEAAQPKLEFCRVLLWSREELASQVAESVIAIHEAFQVPLFFIETARADRARDVDYIFFANETSVISGFYGLRGEGYTTHAFPDSLKIPTIGEPEKHFWRLFRTAQPLFAVDQREMVVQAPTPSRSRSPEAGR